MDNFELIEFRTLWTSKGSNSYEFQGFINKADFGRIGVFLDVRNGQKVAGKIVRRKDDVESRNWPRLQHPNLMPLFERISLDKQTRVLMMPLVGLDLREIITSEDFRHHSDSFRRKKSYVEDILWGLQYIHQKKMCLMNLNEKHIWICSKTDKAILGEFSCLSHFYRFRESDFFVNTFYRPPEMLKPHSSETFDAIAAEMWVFGIIILKIFCYNAWCLNLSYILSSKKLVNDVLLFKDSITSEMLNLEHVACVLPKSINLELQQFLNKFLTLDPTLRCSASVAVMDPFLDDTRYTTSCNNIVTTDIGRNEPFSLETKNYFSILKGDDCDDIIEQPHKNINPEVNIELNKKIINLKLISDKNRTDLMKVQSLEQNNNKIYNLYKPDIISQDAHYSFISKDGRNNTDYMMTNGFAEHNIHQFSNNKTETSDFERVTENRIKNTETLFENNCLLHSKADILNIGEMSRMHSNFKTNSYDRYENANIFDKGSKLTSRESTDNKIQKGNSDAKGKFRCMFLNPTITENNGYNIELNSIIKSKKASIKKPIKYSRFVALKNIFLSQKNKKNPLKEFTFQNKKQPCYADDDVSVPDDCQGKWLRNKDTRSRETKRMSADSDTLERIGHHDKPLTSNLWLNEPLSETIKEAQNNNATNDLNLQSNELCTGQFTKNKLTLKTFTLHNEKFSIYDQMSKITLDNSRMHDKIRVTALEDTDKNTLTRQQNFARLEPEKLFSSGHKICFKHSGMILPETDSSVASTLNIQKNHDISASDSVSEISKGTLKNKMFENKVTEVAFPKDHINKNLLSTKKETNIIKNPKPNQSNTKKDDRKCHNCFSDSGFHYFDQPSKNIVQSFSSNDETNVSQLFEDIVYQIKEQQNSEEHLHSDEYLDLSKALGRGEKTLCLQASALRESEEKDISKRNIVCLPCKEPNTENERWANKTTDQIPETFEHWCKKRFEQYFSHNLNYSSLNKDSNRTKNKDQRYRPTFHSAFSEKSKHTKVNFNERKLNANVVYDNDKTEISNLRSQTFKENCVHPQTFKVKNVFFINASKATLNQYIREPQNIQLDRIYKTSQCVSFDCNGSAYLKLHRNIFNLVFLKKHFLILEKILLQKIENYLATMNFLESLSEKNPSHLVKNKKQKTKPNKQRVTEISSKKENSVKMVETSLQHTLFLIGEEAVVSLMLDISPNLKLVPLNPKCQNFKRHKLRKHIACNSVYLPIANPSSTSIGIDKLTPIKESKIANICSRNDISRKNVKKANRFNIESKKKKLNNCMNEKKHKINDNVDIIKNIYTDLKSTLKIFEKPCSSILNVKCHIPETYVVWELGTYIERVSISSILRKAIWRNWHHSQAQTA